MVEAAVGVGLRIVRGDAALPYGGASIKTLLARIYEAPFFSLGASLACLYGDDHLWAAPGGAGLPLAAVSRLALQQHGETYRSYI